MNVAPPSRLALLRLYRDLLREARRFPSKKRAGLLADIRLEWRERNAAALAEPGRAAHALELAVRGLATLRKYTRLDARAEAWAVTLEQDPLGAGGREEGGAARRRAEAAALAAEQRDLRGGEVEVLPGSPAVRRLE